MSRTRLPIILHLPPADIFRRYRASRRWGVAVCKQTGWGWMRGLGFTLQVPRPRHPKAASAAERQAWKRRHGPVDCRAAPPAPRQAGRALGRG